MAQTVAGRATRFLLREFLGELLYFPVWWYTDGLRRFGLGLINQLVAGEYRLGVRILVRTLFQPMYGDRTRSGRIISFFMRLVLIGGKGLALLFWVMMLLVSLAVWLLLPVVSLGLLLRQVIPSV